MCSGVRLGGWAAVAPDVRAACTTRCAPYSRVSYFQLCTGDAVSGKGESCVPHSPTASNSRRRSARQEAFAEQREHAPGPAIVRERKLSELDLALAAIHIVHNLRTRGALQIRRARVSSLCSRAGTHLRLRSGAGAQRNERKEAQNLHHPRA